MEVALKPGSFRWFFFCWYNSNYLLRDSFNQINVSLQFKIQFFQCLFSLFDRLCNEPSIISQCNYYINHQVNTLIIKWLHDVEAFQTTQNYDLSVFCAVTSSCSLGYDFLVFRVIFRVSLTLFPFPFSQFLSPEYVGRNTNLSLVAAFVCVTG